MILLNGVPLDSPENKSWGELGLQACAAYRDSSSKGIPYTELTLDGKTTAGYINMTAEILGSDKINPILTTLLAAMESTFKERGVEVVCSAESPSGEFRGLPGLLGCDHFPDLASLSFCFRPR